MSQPYGDADMTNSDGSGYAPSTIPPHAKLKDAIGKAQHRRRREVDKPKPRKPHEADTSWNRGT